MPSCLKRLMRLPPTLAIAASRRSSFACGLNSIRISSATAGGESGRPCPEGVATAKLAQRITARALGSMGREVYHRGARSREPGAGGSQNRPHYKDLTPANNLLTSAHGDTGIQTSHG